MTAPKGSGKYAFRMKNPNRLCELTSYSIVALSLSLTGVNAQSVKPTQTALTEVVDVALPGPAVRFDYQSLDATNGRLYIAHMNADQLVVFDLASRKVIANLDGFKRVHGVIAVPEINRVFASVTGDHQAAAVDTQSFKKVASGGPIDYPDGLAYAPKQKKLFVSDEHGGVDAVLDGATCKLITRVPLGGGAGNTAYDHVSGHILVAVHSVNQLVAIDPNTNTILGKSPLPGIQNPHGIAPAEGDVAIREGDQPGVGDGDAMRVGTEIAQDMFRSAEGRLGVDDPVVSEQYPQPGSEGARMS